MAFRRRVGDHTEGGVRCGKKSACSPNAISRLRLRWVALYERRFITAAARVQAKDAVIAPYLVVAGTDSRNFSAVSRDVYRFMPMLFTMKETAMIHGTNEHMSIENLRRMVGFYAQLIATSAG